MVQRGWKAEKEFDHIGGRAQRQGTVVFVSFAVPARLKYFYANWHSLSNIELNWYFYRYFRLKFFRLKSSLEVRFTISS